MTTKKKRDGVIYSLICVNIEVIFQSSGGSMTIRLLVLIKCIAMVLIVNGVFAASSAGALVDHTGELFEMDSKRAVKVFDYEHSTSDKEDGLKEVTGAFKDLKGELAFEEKALIKGSELIKDEIDQRQLKQKATIEKVDKEIVFTLTDSDGKTKTSREKFKGSLVVAATFSPWVRDHWEQLVKGEKIEFRYGVWNRQETVGFELFKVSEEIIDEKKTFKFKMKASSFIIAALVDPIYFTYSDKGERLLSYVGRTSPKLPKDKGGWKDFDAEIVYHY
jgi:hypothetical protein